MVKEMIIRRISHFALIIFLLSFMAMPVADAWSWKTHSDIVDVVYNGLPVDVQKNLDLNMMRDGSNDPDEKFHDFTDHSYPGSLDKAQSWLDQGKAAYDSGNYPQASYDYGVASHYISDTFSAPHAVSGESSSEHSSYEDSAKRLTPVANYVTGDLNTLMQDGKNQGAKSWANWVEVRDDPIIQNDLNRGASVTLSAIRNSINSTSTNNKAGSFIDPIMKFLRGIFST